MGSPIFTSSLAAVRRAMKRHQDIPPRSHVPLPVLVAGEAVYLLRRYLRPERYLAAVLGASLVVAALSSATPGPVAALPLLVVLATVAAGLGGYLGARLFGPARLPRRSSSPHRRRPPRPRR